MILNDWKLILKTSIFFQIWSDIPVLQFPHLLDICKWDCSRDWFACLIVCLVTFIFTYFLPECKRVLITFYWHTSVDYPIIIAVVYRVFISLGEENLFPCCAVCRGVIISIDFFQSSGLFVGLFTYFHFFFNYFSVSQHFKGHGIVLGLWQALKVSFGSGLCMQMETLSMCLSPKE